MSPRGAAFVIIAVVLGALLTLITSGMIWESLIPRAFDPNRPVWRPDDIHHAVYAEGRLWILTQGGELLSVSEGGELRREATGGHVLELCVRDGVPSVLTAPRRRADAWAFRTKRGDDWPAFTMIRAGGDQPLAVFCAGESQVLTNRRLIRLTDAGQQTQTLSTRLPIDFENVSLAMPDQILFAFNHGEIGSALYGIHPRTGAVRQIYKHPPDDPCAGPLGRYCDAVTGLTPLPWKPGCVAATVQVSHIGMHGRLIEICGSTPRRLYFGPCPYPGDWAERYRRGDEPDCSELFFGLVGRKRTVLALGSEGLSEHGEQGFIRQVPLPDFSAYGRFRIAFGPDFVLVGTQPGGAGPGGLFDLIIVPRPTDRTATEASPLALSP
jgi:hypothetical protein